MNPSVDETILLHLLNDRLAKDLTPDQRQAALICLMSGAAQHLDALQMPDGEYVVKLEHPRVGITSIPINPSALAGTTGSILDISQTMIEHAATTAAAGSIDARSFDCANDYRDALVKRAAGFQVITVQRSGDTIVWNVHGTDGAGAPFAVDVDAYDDEDADFQARWAAQVSRDPRTILTADLPAFIAALYEFKISSKEPKPIELLAITGAAMELLLHCRELPNDTPIASLLKSTQFADVEALLLRAVRITPGASEVYASTQAATIPEEPPSADPLPTQAADNHPQPDTMAELFGNNTDELPDPVLPASEPEACEDDERTSDARASSDGLLHEPIDI